MITIYWHCLETKASDQDEKFVAGALDQLTQHLMVEPIKLSIRIKRLDDQPKLAKEIDAILNKLNEQSYTFCNCAAEIIHRISCFFAGGSHLGKTVPVARLLVYCSPDTQIAKAALRKEPSNLWGSMWPFKTPAPITGILGALPGCFAAAYRPNNKTNICHEALHMLGVDECYDPVTKEGTCEKAPGCIMGYGSPEKTCENWPFLCDNNIRILQELAKRAENARFSYDAPS